MSTYAKGEQPRDLEAACGGKVLARTQNWQKDPDPDFHPLGTGLNGPFNTQSYTKTGDYGGKYSVCEGDNKSKKSIMPRK